jgi:hypothetical protein
MSDYDDRMNDEPLGQIAKKIEGLNVPARMPPEVKWPDSILPLKRAHTHTDPTLGSGGSTPASVYTGPKNEDVPRAGELSSKVFNDLTTRIIGELKEAVETLITDAQNRRLHVGVQMESYQAEVDKMFGEFEAHAKKLQEKVNIHSEAIRKKVESDTREMIALSNRLREFADSVNTAHEKFFEEPDNGRS